MKRLGKYQKNMLVFAKMLGKNKLHSLAKDSFTQKVARSLESRGLIVINQYNQFSITDKGMERVK